jgi:hypothetical protein
MVIPKRIRRSRAKGWTLPENTVIVDRTSRWGNPFVVGKHGVAAQCVYWYSMLLNGYLLLGRGVEQEQERAHCTMVDECAANWPTLKGKDLACWCALDKPCHADVLLHSANGRPFDIKDYMHFHGYSFTKAGLVRD